MSRINKKKQKKVQNKKDGRRRENISKKETQKKEERLDISRKENIQKEPKKTVVQKEEKKERKQNTHEKSSLKTFFKVFFILFIVLLLGLYYMRFIETKLLFVKEVKLENPLIPESLSGLKIVHFSDLHYGIVTEEKDLNRLVQKIQQIRPDILVFTGDLLDEDGTYKEDDYRVLTEALSKMEVPISKYYIKGNHDYSNGMIDTIFETSGFVSLNNKRDIIYGTSSEKIQIVGMGSFLQNDFHQEAAFEGIEDGLYTVALFHEPDNIMELKGRNIQLALAGHAHNNQNGIPYLRDLFTKEGARTYYDSHHQINDTELYINSGIGTSHNKLRFFAPPTINLYRLVQS